MTGRNGILSRITNGAPFYPLFVLAGLNLVDELDRTAFNVLTPNIKEEFGLNLSGVLVLVALVGLATLVIEIPLAFWADRSSRVRLAGIGAGTWAMFSVFTGLAPGLIALGIARAGAGIGRAVVAPTHNSLLADYYEPDARAKVFGFHRGANALGQAAGPLLAGLLAAALDWRAPFILFAIPTVVFVLLALRMREPLRGSFERLAMGASKEEAETEEFAPSFAESWRILWQIRVLRRFWYALPFLGASLLGLGALTSLFYEQQFGLDEAERGFVIAAVEPVQVIGLLLGIPLASRLARRDPGLILRFVALTGALTGAGFAMLALAPNVQVAVAANLFVSAASSVVGPAILAGLSLVIPPRVRSLGFSVGSVWILPGLVILPIIGAVGDAFGIRIAMLLMVPVFLTGAFIMASSAPYMESDVNKVRTSSLVQAQARAARLAGDPKIVIVKGVDVSYGQTQVLFGVDLEVADGEMVALLGTNGAGKSTLLKAICGSAEPTAGAIVFDGRDITWMPADQAVGQGVIIVPGGKGVFPTLTVAENLSLAGWRLRDDPDHVARATEEVLEHFPILRDRWNQKAGNLSGGEQQMLTLGQALIARPKLLMIDELSLGLAPIIVEQLLHVVRRIHASGTTVILVEQSINVALTLAPRAVFMEKGEIRFDGPTTELLARPDILRAVFLEGAGTLENGSGKGAATNGAARLPARARKPDVVAGSADEAPALAVEGIATSFGGIRAVAGVSLDVRQGQVLGLIGPNGAGKTTIFDLISGYVTAEAGSVLIQGVDMTSASPDARARAGLGRSFQDARLFPAMTVSQAIAGALERHVETRDPIAALLVSPATRISERKVAARVDELIELMRLEAYSNKFVAELSTGTRRIVDLACLLGHEPRVLLLDEPSSGIAQRETEALGPLLLDIREQTGAAMLVIEHDMPLISTVSDELVALELGQVIARGAPNDVLHDPAVVSSYLGGTEEVIFRSGVVPSAAGEAPRKGNGHAPRRRRTPG